MDFLIPAGGATNLPKELIEEVIQLAEQKSKVYQLIKNRGHNFELLNEGTLPVIGLADEDKVYLTENTTDVTTLSENTFDIKHPDLRPRELGTHAYMKKKHVQQYSALQLENLFKEKLATALAKQVEKITLVGDTSAVGATNPLTIADGIVTIAGDATKAAATPVTYTTSQTQDILNAVIDAKENIGEYSSEDFANDLFIYASSDFYGAVKKNADRDIIGFSIEPVEELGLRSVVHLDGVPVFKRTQLTGEQAVLANMRGAAAGFYGDQMSVDMQWKAELRAYLMVLTFWYDFVWGFVNSSSKLEGIVKISKAT